MKNYRYVALVLATVGIIISTLYNDLLPNGQFLMGICIGVLFVILAQALTNRWLNRNIKLDDLASNEEILLEEGSTNFSAFQAKSGKLFLTNKRLSFHSAGLFGKSNPPIDIKRSAIKKTAIYNRALLPTGFQVETKEGTTYAFAADDREKWIKMLEKNTSK